MQIAILFHQDHGTVVCTSREDNIVATQNFSTY